MSETKRETVPLRCVVKQVLNSTKDAVDLAFPDDTKIRASLLPRQRWVPITRVDTTSTSGSTEEKSDVVLFPLATSDNFRTSHLLIHSHRKSIGDVWVFQEDSRSSGSGKGSLCGLSAPFAWDDRKIW
jgi:hypothetical protein